MLSFIERNYSIDIEREYLTGISLGGYGTWNYAMLNPKRFAAIIPICGGATFPTRVTLIKDLPIWAFHGRQDKSVPFEESEILVKVLQKINGNIKFSEYPKLGHELCTLAYENQEIYNWLLNQKRKITSE